MEFMGEGKEGNWEASKHASKKKGKAACMLTKDYITGDIVFISDLR
jgi:hypothetical protein